MIKTLLVNAEMGDATTRMAGKPGFYQSRSDLTPAVNLMNMCIALSEKDKQAKADPMKDIAKRIKVIDENES